MFYSLKPNSKDILIPNHNVLKHIQFFSAMMKFKTRENNSSIRQLSVSVSLEDGRN